LYKTAIAQLFLKIIPLPPVREDTTHNNSGAVLSVALQAVHGSAFGANRRLFWHRRCSRHVHHILHSSRSLFGKQLLMFNYLKVFNAVNLQQGYHALDIYSPREVTSYEKD